MVLGSADIIFHLFSVKISISDLRSIEWPNLAIFRVSAKIFWTQGTQPTSPPMILCSGYGFGKRWYHFSSVFCQSKKNYFRGLWGCPRVYFEKKIYWNILFVSWHILLYSFFWKKNTFRIFSIPQDLWKLFVGQIGLNSHCGELSGTPTVRSFGI